MEAPRIDRRGSLLLVAALALGIALRFLRLDRTGLYIDEAWSWAFAGQPLAGFLDLAVTDFHPPLYYLLLKLWLAIVPATEASLRVPSAIFSTASLAMIAWFVRRRWGPAAAFYATLLAALSSFDLHYAQDTRMYALLALLWFGSFALMVEALLGSRRAVLPWATLAVLLPWTHLYGVAAAGAEAGTVVLLGAGQARRKGADSSRGGTILETWTGRLSLLLVVGNAAVVVALFWKQRQTAYGGGGAWYPGPQDLGGLLGLAIDGVAAARVHFLDAGHLVPAWLARVPFLAWGLVGLALSLPAARGLARALRTPGPARTVALASLLAVLGPVLGLFAYARLLHLRFWAFKPLLACAYVLYVWLGAGLAGLGRPALRRAVAGAVVVVNLASLIPFFTTWERWPIVKPLRTLATEIRADESVLVERGDYASTVFFYLPQCETVWGLEDGGAGGRVRVGTFPRSDPIRAAFQDAGCDDPRWPSIRGFRYFGATEWLRPFDQRWPECVRARSLHVYGRGGWREWWPAKSGEIAVPSDATPAAPMTNTPPGGG